MHDRRYDLVFSLGAACSCTESLRAAGLQYLSFPFDWLYGSDIRGRTELLIGGFADWLRPELMEEEERPAWNPDAIYVNRKTGISFNHDFPCDVPFADAFPRVVERYRRRIDRLMALIRGAKRVLAVWVNIPTEPPVDDAEVIRCRERLQARFPEVEFDLLCFQPVDGLDVAKDVALADGVRKVSFDFGFHGPKDYAWKVDVPKLLPWLADYSVRDYRTLWERLFGAFRKRRDYLHLPWQTTNLKFSKIPPCAVN